MVTVEAITELIEQRIKETDIFVVEVAVKAGNVIRVYVDRPDGISIDECVKISRHLNEMMDREVEDFALEVSSPGLTAPLKVKQQYEKNLGRSIDILFLDGDRLTGKVKSVLDKGVILETKEDDKEVLFEEIKTAKAIISFN